MPELLQSDYFVIGMISLAALLVNKHELVSAAIYAAFCWIALFACYQIPAPEWLLELSHNHEMTQKGWEIMLGMLACLFVIALIYQVRRCIDGMLPKIIIWLCLAEILLHITCYGLLLNGMSLITYNWIILTHQIAIILLFAARGGYGRDFLRTRLFRDSVHSH